MQPATIRIGLLFSQSGSYAALGRAMSAGASLAADQINASGLNGVTIELLRVDPAGQLDRYVEGARSLLGEAGLKHVVGCYTSSSRKEVLPFFEKHDALLWYPSHYEGFETSDNVVYTGASPNQHIVPLARHLLGQSRHRGWFVGSNYIWAWENNRIMREALSVVPDGEVVGERYIPVGETDVGDLVRQIVQDRPDFVFATLIGSSLYAFLERLREASHSLGLDQASDMPVVTCSLSEAELPLIEKARSGHITSSVYFSAIDTSENHAFTREWNARFGDLGHASADAEATFCAVHLLARAVKEAGTDELEAVREAVRGMRFAAPQGEITIEPDNLHACMRPRIGRSRQDGTFDVLYESPRAIRPDPYLTWTSEAEFADHGPANLKVVK